jgi:hypothetical protein
MPHVVYRTPVQRCMQVEFRYYRAGTTIVTASLLRVVPRETVLDNSYICVKTCNFGIIINFACACACTCAWHYEMRQENIVAEDDATSSNIDHVTCIAVTAGMA